VALFERVFSENIGNVSFLKRKNKTILRRNSEGICKNVVDSLHFRINYCIIKDGKTNFKNEN
jgi:hypothetical protein